MDQTDLISLNNNTRETTTSERNNTRETTTTGRNNTGKQRLREGNAPEEMTVSEEETTTLPSPDDENLHRSYHSSQYNNNCCRATVGKTPTTTPFIARITLSDEGVVVGIPA